MNKPIKVYSVLFTGFFLLLIYTNSNALHSVYSSVDDYLKVEQLNADTISVGVDTNSVAIDTSRSVIKWRGTEMQGMAGKHEGTVHFKKGYILVSDGKLAGGNFIADMQSIRITDIPQHEVIARRNLRTHLKSEDFFFLKKYPTAQLNIIRVEKGNSDSLHVTADLTVRDVREEITFKTGSYSEKCYHTSFSIDRFKWNVSYQGNFWERWSALLSDNLVDDEIQLEVIIALVSASDKTSCL